MLIPRSLATIPINGAKEIMIIAELKVTIRICPRTTQRNQVWCSDVVMIIFEYPSTDLPSARLSRLSIAGARCLPNTNRGIRYIFRMAGRVRQMTTYAPSGWHHSCRRYRHSWRARNSDSGLTGPRQPRRLLNRSACSRGLSVGLLAYVGHVWIGKQIGSSRAFQLSVLQIYIEKRTGTALAVR